MLLAVAALAVIQRGEGVEETELMVSGTGLFTRASLSSEDGGETSSSLLPVGQNVCDDDMTGHVVASQNVT